MRFIHISDLHLGKSIYGVSMIENGDQDCWVDRLLQIVDEKEPEAVVIAGDVFDRKAPPEDAVRLFGRLVTALNERGIPVLTTAGNHDSVYRLSYLGKILAGSGVHFSTGLTESYMSGKDDGEEIVSSPILNHVTLNDEHGPVTFWLMPYVFPALVQNALGDDSIRDYDAAARALLAAQPFDPEARNVVIAHQNVTSNGDEAERGGSESMVGGVGQVDFTAFDKFDYAALGHIHAACHVGRKSVRYAGSPLCYHFDETRQKTKGPVLVTLEKKGDEVISETLHIKPLHPMREIRGSYDEVRDSELASDRRGEYLRIVIEDRRITPEMAAFFRELYRTRDSILMELKSEYRSFTGKDSRISADKVEALSVEDLFADFYRERRGGEDPSNDDIELMGFAGDLMRSGDTGQNPDPSATDKLLRYLLAQSSREVSKSTEEKGNIR